MHPRAVAVVHRRRPRVGARIGERAAAAECRAFIDRDIRSRIHCRGHVVDGHHHRIARRTGIVIHNRVGHRVCAVVVWHKRETAAVAIGDRLAIARHHAPRLTVRVGDARIGEAGDQVDGSAFVDHLVDTSIHVLRRDVRDVDRRRGRVRQAAIVGDSQADEHGTWPIEADCGEGRRHAGLIAAAACDADFTEDVVAVQIPLIGQGRVGLVRVGTARSTELDAASLADGVRAARIGRGWLVRRDLNRPRKLRRVAAGVGGRRSDELADGNRGCPGDERETHAAATIGRRESRVEIRFPFAESGGIARRAVEELQREGGIRRAVEAAVHFRAA